MNVHNLTYRLPFAQDPEKKVAAGGFPALFGGSVGWEAA
jgi:hypothetical protein